MADSLYTYGIYTKPDTGEVFDVELETVKRSVKNNWSSVKGEDGKQKESRLASKTTTINFDGTVKKDAGDIGTGSVIAIGGKDFKIMSIDTTESGDYNKISVSCERTDDENVVAEAEVVTP